MSNTVDVSESPNSVVVVEADNTVSVMQVSNAVTVASPGPAGPDELSELQDVALSSPAAGEVLTYNGATWENGPGPLNASASSSQYSGGFFPGASMVSQVSSTSMGVDQRFLYFAWCPVEKELVITGLFIDVATAYNPSDLMRIGLFSYDLADLSTQYDAQYSFTLWHDFGTLPLDVAGEQAIDLSATPLVVPPGMYAVGTASSFASSEPRVNGVALAYNVGVPSSLTTVSAGVRSYSTQRNTFNWTASVLAGFPSTSISCNSSAAPSPAHHGATVVFFRGYTTQ